MSKQKAAAYRRGPWMHKKRPIRPTTKGAPKKHIQAGLLTCASCKARRAFSRLPSMTGFRPSGGLLNAYSGGTVSVLHRIPYSHDRPEGAAVHSNAYSVRANHTTPPAICQQAFRYIMICAVSRRSLTNPVVDNTITKDDMHRVPPRAQLPAGENRQSGQSPERNRRRKR